MLAIRAMFTPVRLCEPVPIIPQPDICKLVVNILSTMAAHAKQWKCVLTTAQKRVRWF